MEIENFKPDIIICALYGGSFQIPKVLKNRFPNSIIICMFDYNNLEMHNVVGICKIEECFPFVDIWLAPKFMGNWISTVTKKPFIDIYRPYNSNDPELKYFSLEERNKVIEITEHTKGRQCFDARIVARRIMDDIGEEYEVVIKPACQPNLTGKDLENKEKESSCKFYNLKESSGTNPILCIDCFPLTLMGGFHVTNAFKGTPSLGFDVSQACVEAFPDLNVKSYDLPSMISKGVEILKNKDLWNKASKYAHDYAVNHWSFEACRKIWNDEVLPLCQKIKQH
jgi:hypothetical protein